MPSGAFALYSNSSGHDNTASGISALQSNTTGTFNTALGYQALVNNTTGSRNLALGYNAGYSLTTGDKNIYIGNRGVATESSTMRLGNSNQTRTFVTGIYGTTPPAVVVGSRTIAPVSVFVNYNGQLGTLASSARYKRDIQAIGEHSQGLYQLRPVTFKYKQDTQGHQQYGLIAEEVAKVYPELVVWGANGEVESVQYHELIPMLLNEVQRQQQKLEAQAQELAELTARLERLEAGAASVATRDPH